MTVAERSDCRLDHVGRTFEVGLPYPEVDDVFPFMGQYLGAREDFERSFCSEPAHLF